MTRYLTGFGPVNWPHNFVSEVIQNAEVMGARESKASHPVADTKQRAASAGFPFLSSPIPAGSPVLWTMSLTLQVGLLPLISYAYLEMYDRQTQNQAFLLS